MQIQLFVTPPDTADVTPLLDHLKKIAKNMKKKASMFINFNPLNRKVFVLILANIWDKWTSKETLVNAARQVGTTAAQLSVEKMQ